MPPISNERLNELDEYNDYTIIPHTNKQLNDMLNNNNVNSASSCSIIENSPRNSQQSHEILKSSQSGSQKANSDTEEKKLPQEQKQNTNNNSQPNIRRQNRKKRTQTQGKYNPLTSGINLDPSQFAQHQLKQNEGIKK